MTKADLESAKLAREEACAWLLHLRSDHSDGSDAAAFRQWSDDHPAAADLLRDTWGSLRVAAAEVAQEEQAKARAPAANTNRSKNLRTGRRAFVGFALAAGVSWLAVSPPLGLWPSLADLASDYRTGTGEQRRVVLSDRIAVEMNTQTSLELLKQQDGVHGVKLVAGEAEFDAMAPDATRTRPLIPVAVMAGNGRIGANVGRFNVRRTQDTVCVTCLTGALTLDHPEGRFTLQAGDQVIYDDRKVRPVARIDTENVTAWRRGLLVFNNVPLSDVVEEINRYRPGKIIIRNTSLGANRVQAQFPITRLDDAVNMLCRLYDGHITRLPGRIELMT
jgi:transmembrane sensor